METTSKGQAERQAQLNQQIGNLAFERLTHIRRIEEIDAQLAVIEGMLRENEKTRRELLVDAQLAAAKAKTETKEEPNG